MIKVTLLDSSHQCLRKLTIPQPADHNSIPSYLSEKYKIKELELLYKHPSGWSNEPNSKVGVVIKKREWKDLKKQLEPKQVDQDDLNLLSTKIEQMNRRILQLEHQVQAMTATSTPTPGYRHSVDKQVRREKWKYEPQNVKMDPDLKLTPNNLKDLIEIQGTRDDFLQTVKDYFKQWGCRGRIPYADRFDKQGKLQITWMCSLHYYFHRDIPNYVGCPFQIQFKGVQVGENPTQWKAICGKEYHNHAFTAAVVYNESAALIDQFRGKGRQKGETVVKKVEKTEKKANDKESGGSKSKSGGSENKQSDSSRDSSYTAQLKARIAEMQKNRAK